MSVSGKPEGNSSADGALAEQLYRKIETRLSPRDFDAWFRRTSCRFESPSTFVFTAVNSFRRAWIEKRYGDLLREAARQLCAGEPRLRFEIAAAPSPGGDSLRPGGEAAAPLLCPPDPPAGCPGAEKSFDSFIVGPSNKVAFAAATTVAELPGKSYNPLIIHGPSGTGKTHLLRAIGHFLTEGSHLRHLYITAEAFSNHYLHCVERRDLDSFRSRYQSADVLLVDDIHFLEGKRKTLEEFFRTCNSLLSEHKQVGLTSLSPPHELSGFQDGLASQLRWGLIAKVEPADERMRLDLALARARHHGYTLSHEIALLLARTAGPNLRELEGALNRLLSVCRFYRTPPTTDLARDVLGDLLADTEPRPPAPVAIEAILEALSDHYRLSPAEILSPSKVRAFVLARQMGMYLARHLTPLSLQQIGRRFGGRDHTTVLYAQRRVETLLENDPRARADFDALRLRLLRPH